MDSDLEDFISHLGDDDVWENNRFAEVWKEFEDYADKQEFDVNEFLNELFPMPQSTPPPTFHEYLKQRGEEEVEKILEPVCRVSTEEFVKRFAIPLTFNESLISDPILDFTDKNFLPTELLLASIQQYISNTSASASNKRSFSMDQNASNVEIYDASDNEEDENCLDEPPCYFNRIQTNYINSFETNWSSILEGQNITPGITVDSVVENIMQNCATTQTNSPTHTEIYGTISLLFKVLNDYINRFTIEFADNKFFNIDHLYKLSHRLQEDALSPSNIKDNSLLQVLSKWMGVVTQNFIQINDQRRQIEEKVSEEVIDEAVKIYKTRLDSYDKTTNLREICCKGFLQAYSNCCSEFKMEKMKDLEMRLEEVNSNKTKLSPNRSSDSNDYNVPIQLLISEYARNINQKGIQCASISTLEQFDDVNKNCRADVTRNFAKRIDEDGVSPTKRSNLMHQFQSELESESQKTRFEYEGKVAGFGVSTGAKSSSFSSTRPLSVGIHFGFEMLSVNYFDESNKTFRSIYGPSVNLISFTSEGVFIGQIPPIQNSVTFDMQDLLTGLDLDVLRDTAYNGKLRLEAIIALVFMQIDQITKLCLHNNSIKYAIAIPSCFNKVMQETFANAMKIGKIDGNLVREQCAITAHFLRQNHQHTTKDDYLITIIENSFKSCDYVTYSRNSKTIGVSHVNGFDEEKPNLLMRQLRNGEPGVQLALNNITAASGKRYRFIICCTRSLQHERIKRIKHKFNQSNVQWLPFDSVSLAKGAAFLSSVADNRSSGCPLDLKCLTAIHIKDAHPTQFYRLKHIVRYLPHNLSLLDVSNSLNGIVEKQSREFVSVKAMSKQFLLGKVKDLEETKLSSNQKKQYRKELENALKAVEEEPINSVAIQLIAEPWYSRQF